MSNTAINDLSQRAKAALKALHEQAVALDQQVPQLLTTYTLLTQKGEYGYKDEPIAEHLLGIMHQEGCTNIAHLADGVLASVVQVLLGEEYARVYRAYLGQLALSPYSRGYYRRSLRSAQPHHYTEMAAEALRTLMLLRCRNYDEATLLGAAPEDARGAYSDHWHNDLNPLPWMVGQLALGTPSVVEHLREAMLSDNNHRILTRDHFRAIAMGGNAELLELYGRLLLAARLQEGLRQAIMETCDEGTLDAFWYIYDLVQREGLLRFASVKRALACAIGLGAEAADERHFEKYLRLMALYRDDTQARDAALAGSDTVALYLALWSIGCQDIEAAIEKAKGIVQEGTVLQVCTVLEFVDEIQDEVLKYRMARLALHRWGDEPRILSYALSSYCYALDPNYYKRLSFEQLYPNRADAVADYHLLSRYIPLIDKKQVWEGLVFPWTQQTLEKESLVRAMVNLALSLDDAALQDDVLDYLQFSTWRGWLLKDFFRPDKSERHRAYLFTALADRESSTRELACEWLRSMELRPEEVLQLEDHLRLKAAGMRIAIIQKLASLPEDTLVESATRLLRDKSADRRLAGLDLLRQVQQQGEAKAELCTRLLPLLDGIAKPTAKEQPLIDQLRASTVPHADHAAGMTAPLPTCANGFGLHAPKAQYELPIAPIDFDYNAFIAPLQKGLLKKIVGGENRIEQLFKQLDARIAEHKDEEYVDRWGEKRLLKSGITAHWEEDGKSPIEQLAFPELWRDFYEHEMQHDFDLLVLMHLATSFAEKYSYVHHPQLVEQLYEGVDRAALRKLVKSLTYSEHVALIVGRLREEYFDANRWAHLAAGMLQRVLSLLTPDQLIARQEPTRYDPYTSVCFPDSTSCIFFWMAPEGETMSDECFAQYFAPLYTLYQKHYVYELQDKEKYDNTGQHLLKIARAFRQGLLPEEAVYRMLMEDKAFGLRAFGSLLYKVPYDYQVRRIFHKRKAEEFDYLLPFIERTTSVLLDIELRRGDTPTEATPMAYSIMRLWGVETFVRVLAALGKDKFARNSYGSNRDSKRVAQTHLLCACRPTSDDTGRSLAAAVKEAGLSAERLVEAAMLVPTWLPLVEEATGWKGLTSAAYYFRAHTAAVLDGGTHNEETPEVQHEQAIIARYTPIDLKDLAIGAFDIEWFRSAYKTLGKARFEVVYAAAKYVSESNSHGRARKFADAVNGTLKAAATLTEIKAKRNKDLLMAYGLIPLGRRGEAELLARYRYIQQFLKESREFGAQRQASEKQAAEIALQNLARNSEYGDATRLTWTMETLLVEEMSAYFVPQPLDDLSLFVHLDEEGKASLCVEKAGKALKSLPAKYKKHKLVEKLREVVRHLKDQHSRSRLMLEQAMEQCTPFRVAELSLLMRNPVIWPLMQHLVFVSEENQAVGFYHEGALINPQGRATAHPSAESTLRIAHAVDLHASGQWSDFQQCLFERSIKQPFKQVFRELYLPTDEERQTTQSLRYAGHQIMPQRSVALLKKRKWVATYEDGLQRIFHNEGIIATIYAMADWFSPSDIEPPTLEYVCFYERGSYRSLRLEEVPPVLFSEVMRDVDLVVSVAHAGGVDPEASHSTIEMREAIVRCTLPLFRIDNVELKGTHAHIQGKLARYSVHLGSGVVHQDAGAALNILPVHSQSRGRLFLPFVDEDPKTAEILSKILLLADDERIKDPYILEQIVR